MLKHRSRIALGVALWALAVFFPAGSASAVDCVGPDDPPGCVTPAPSVTPDPAPSVTPDPAPTSVLVVVDDSQYAPVIWGIGALLSLSLVSVIGSWSK
jgi:hypothetical protein